jgi:hypothetical protein
VPLTYHREMHTKSGASRMYPVSPVRIVTTQHKPVGWLECSVAEFMLLLAQHEAGEINLLAMPEMAGDEVEIEPDVEEVETEAEVAPVATEGHTTGSSNVDRIRRCLVNRQLTMTQVMELTGLTKMQVKSAMQHSALFVRVQDGRKQDKKWRLR